MVQPQPLPVKGSENERQKTNIHKVYTAKLHLVSFAVCCFFTCNWCCCLGSLHFSHDDDDNFFSFSLNNTMHVSYAPHSFHQLYTSTIKRKWFIQEELIKRRSIISIANNSTWLKKKFLQSWGEYKKICNSYTARNGNLDSRIFFGRISPLENISLVTFKKSCHFPKNNCCVAV